VPEVGGGALVLTAIAGPWPTIRLQQLERSEDHRKTEQEEQRRPSIHSTATAGTRVAAHTPTDEASAWLIVVAIRTPSKTAQGR